MKGEEFAPIWGQILPFTKSLQRNHFYTCIPRMHIFLLCTWSCAYWALRLWILWLLYKRKYSTYSNSTNPPFWHLWLAETQISLHKMGWVFTFCILWLVYTRPFSVQERLRLNYMCMKIHLGSVVQSSIKLKELIEGCVCFKYWVFMGFFSVSLKYKR